MTINYTFMNLMRSYNDFFMVDSVSVRKMLIAVFQPFIY